ncbi:hypothetical protein HYFRA_00000880, partial [Hymenoscyphus fraxineus]
FVPRSVFSTLQLLVLAQPVVHARLVGIPTVPFTESSTYSTFPLNDLRSIVVDAKYADAVDLEGETLIPPTLTEFANTFSSDLESSLGLSIPVQIDSGASTNSVFLTVAEDNSTFTDAAGRVTSEGYTLNVTSEAILITGASPLGVFWGTRTLLQQAVLGELNVPLGVGTDSPGWRNRGIMIDVARKYHPKEFIIEMCAYLSFYKQNTFHLHLSDNLYNNVARYSIEYAKTLYAAFRLNSDDPLLAGLSKRANESYYREDFEEMQQKCASRGVTIIPEIESPGHAMVINQWKPELALSTDFSLLNLTHPDTLPTVKTIWKVLLPWMHSKTVSIGADEYNSTLRIEYNAFVNAMNDFIAAESGKKIRIWGTFPPVLNSTSNVNKSVSIQHWASFEDNAKTDYIDNEISVLNTADDFYMVGKSPFSWYPPYINVTEPFSGGPQGGPYYPNTFNNANSSDNPPLDNPYLLGHIAALWNDIGPNATTVMEAYYSFRDGSPGLADKQWGGDLEYEEYKLIFDKLHAAIPGQNLDWAIPSVSDTILSYDFTETNGTMVKDVSGNSYDGSFQDLGINPINDTAITFNGKGYISTPLDSKGRNYTLSFSVRPTSETQGTLFEGSQNALRTGDGGTIGNVTMISGGNPYTLNYTLPINVWTDLSLVGAGNQTFLYVKEGESSTVVHEFITREGYMGENTYWYPIAFEAPLAKIGEGFEGQMKCITLMGSA